MLVALKGDKRIEAEHAGRADDFFCPQCRKSVRLRRRRGYVLHFFHLVNAGCPSHGEGAAHLAAKRMIGEEYRRRGCHVEYEWTLAAELERIAPRAVYQRPPERRADIVVYRSKNQPCAIEVQDSHITESEFFGRIRDWHASDVPLLWVAVPSLKLMDFLAGEVTEGAVFERHAIRPFEHWMARRDGRLWYFHPPSARFFAATVVSHMLVKESFAGFVHTVGDFVEGGGYEYKSRKYVDLRFSMAIALQDIRIKIINGIPRWDA